MLHGRVKGNGRVNRRRNRLSCCLLLTVGSLYGSSRPCSPSLRSRRLRAAAAHAVLGEWRRFWFTGRGGYLFGLSRWFVLSGYLVGSAWWFISSGYLVGSSWWFISPSRFILSGYMSGSSHWFVSSGYMFGSSRWFISPRRFILTVYLIGSFVWFILQFFSQVRLVGSSDWIVFSGSSLPAHRVGSLCRFVSLVHLVNSYR